MRTRDDVRLLIEAGIKLGGTAAWDHALEFARLMDGTKDERVIGRTGLIMLLNDLTPPPAPPHLDGEGSLMRVDVRKGKV